MKTVLSLIALSSLCLAAFGCGVPQSVQPDGGRDRIVCTNEFVYITVKVMDAQGNPVEGATVSATNAGIGKTSTATTNSSGVTTAIGEDIGPGTATIQATSGSKVSNTQTVNWVCGECHCTAEPNAITLTLNP